MVYHFHGILNQSYTVCKFLGMVYLVARCLLTELELATRLVSLKVLLSVYLFENYDDEYP